MQKFTFLLATLLPFACLAQPTAEKTNIRIYEHHSSSINQNLPYGYGAEGSQSGYDFVNNDYYDSFNPSTMDGWTATEQANIDLVEHNGGFSSPFGFTSATSTIWGGEIKGNNLTVYAEAPAGFEYALASNASYIKDAMPASTSKEIAAVEVNKVYLAKIRNLELYVAIKITNVKNISPNTRPGLDPDDVYFDFDYKYGYYFPTDVKSISTTEATFSIAPNPSNGSFRIAEMPEGLQMNNATVRIIDMTGRTVYAQPASTTNVQTNLPTGNYMVLLTDGNSSYKSRLVVVE